MRKFAVITSTLLVTLAGVSIAKAEFYVAGNTTPTGGNQATPNADAWAPPSSTPIKGPVKKVILPQSQCPMPAAKPAMAPQWSQPNKTRTLPPAPPAATPQPETTVATPPAQCPVKNNTVAPEHQLWSQPQNSRIISTGYYSNKYYQDQMQIIQNPIPQPKPKPKLVVANIYQGSLKQNLERIAKNNGWDDVLWKLSVDFRWTGTAKIKGKTLPDIFEVVLKDYPLRATFYQGNHIIEITEKKYHDENPTL